MGFDFNRDAIIRISDAVRWVEKQKKIAYGFTGTNGAPPLSDGDDTRIVRITEEICKGEYEGQEVGFMNSTTGSKAQFHSWKSIGQASFNDDPYIGSDSATEPAGSHAGILQELNFRENIPIGTIVYAQYNADIEEDNEDSVYIRRNKWIFDWKGAKGHFMANPFFDEDGHRFFQINCGLVQIGDVEVIVNEKNIALDNIQCSPSPDVCDPSQVPCPSTSPCCMDPTSEFYWVEVVFSYDTVCGSWKATINEELQNAFCQPDLWEVKNADGSTASPTPDDSCPTILQTVTWRLIVGYVDGFDWIQAYCGAMQYPIFPDFGTGVPSVSPSPSPSSCPGFDGNRVYEFSGVISVRGDFLYQTMIEVQEIWDNGKLCESIEFFRERVVGHWCCPSPSPSVIPSPSPSSSPVAPAQNICIEEAGWSEVDINGTYVYNDANDRWEREIDNFTYYVQYDQIGDIWAISKANAGLDCQIYTNPAAESTNPPFNGWEFLAGCGGASTSPPIVWPRSCENLGFCWFDDFNPIGEPFPWPDFGGGTGDLKSTGLLGTEPFDTRWTRRNDGFNDPASEALVADVVEMTFQSPAVQTERAIYKSNFIPFDGDFEVSFDVVIDNVTVGVPEISGPACYLQLTVGGETYIVGWAHSGGADDPDGLGYQVGSSWTNTTENYTGGSFNFKIKRAAGTVTMLIDDVDITGGGFARTGQVTLVEIFQSNSGGGAGTQAGFDTALTNFEFMVADVVVSLINFLSPNATRWVQVNGEAYQIVDGPNEQLLQFVTADTTEQALVIIESVGGTELFFGYKEDGVGGFELFVNDGIETTYATTGVGLLEVNYVGGNKVDLKEDGVFIQQVDMVTNDINVIKLLSTTGATRFAELQNQFFTAAEGNITEDSWLVRVDYNSVNFNSGGDLEVVIDNFEFEVLGEPYCTD